MKEDKKSVVLLIISMCIFGTIGIFRKFIPLSSSFLAMTRGLIGGLFIIIFMLITKKKIFTKIRSKALIALIASGIAIGFNWVLLFQAYNYTSVATATLCYYMEPLIITIASIPIFNEKITPKKIICTFLAICGMVLVSGILTDGQSNPDNLKGIFFGLGAALLYSFVVILNKEITGVNQYQKTAIQLLIAGAAMIPYVFLTEDVRAVQFSALSIILIIVVGIVHTGIAYVLYFSSIEKIPAQTIAIMSYIDPIVALVLSALILKEKMEVISIIGAVLIIGSAIFNEISFKKKA